VRQVGRRLYLVVAPDSWKARHITARGQVAVTVPVRRRGLLSLVLPMPPATVSFHAWAIVHPARQQPAILLEQLHQEPALGSPQRQHPSDEAQPLRQRHP
jgi:hypothetical protein